MCCRFYFLVSVLTLGTVALLWCKCRDCIKGRKRNNPHTVKTAGNNEGNAGESQPQMILNDDATQQRYRRYKDFETFYDKSKEIFEPYKDKDDRTKYLQATHMLQICPGTRNGGVDKRYVEVFWGSKAYDTNEEIKDDFRLHKVIYSEHGSMLTFYKNENGFASIYLIPAGTELTHPYESGICWKQKVNPSRLLNKTYIDKVWNAFMAYMEVTQLDGNPSWIQKIHIWWLRNSRHVVVGKEWQPIKAFVFTKQVAKWVMTVSFSGLAIFLLQLWLIPSPAEHENVVIMKDNSEEINQKLDTVYHVLEGIQSNQDSCLSRQPK